MRYHNKLQQTAFTVCVEISAFSKSDESIVLNNIYYGHIYGCIKARSKWEDLSLTII